MSRYLATQYMGLELHHPIIASAGPLTGRIETLRELEAAGAAAVVLPSLFEEDVERDTALLLSASGIGALVHAESVPQSPLPAFSIDTVSKYLSLVMTAKEALTIPVIASLNGTTASGWTRHAAQVADAGADAIELNVYRVIADFHDTAQSVEDSILTLVEAVRLQVSVPIAVKIGPFFTALPAFVRRLGQAGVNGVTLFNRFYQPDLDLEELSVRASLDLSTSNDLRLPLRWVALLAGNVQPDLALSGGVHNPTDAVKAILAGATVVGSTSALLRSGPAHITTLRDGLAEWLLNHDYESVAQMRGSMSVGNVPDPDAYERANYLRVIQEATSRFDLRV